MIQRIIEWSLKNRFLVFCGALLLIALGVRAVFKTPVDAIPDLTENQVLVYADWMGRSPQEVEDQVTYPLSTGLQGLAGVKDVRATSMFGFSLLTIIFEDNIDTYFARTRVLERLNYLQGAMPDARTPRASAGSINTISTLTRRKRRTAATTSASSARCRTGTSAINSPACRAWPKSRASAAS
jgi:copper/silver efflux system protein